MKRVCMVWEFGPCGFGYLRDGVLPHAVCLWMVRVSWAFGSLSQALIEGMQRDGFRSAPAAAYRGQSL